MPYGAGSSISRVASGILPAPFKNSERRMSTQTATRQDNDLKEYRDALLACKQYHKQHDPIKPGSAEHREYKRLWKDAHEKGDKCLES